MGAPMRYQPQGRARLNRTNPITRGLISVVVGSVTFDVVTGKPLINTPASANATTASRVTSPWGVAVDGRIGQARSPVNGGSISTGSFFALASTTDGTAEQIIMEIGPSGSSFTTGVRGMRYISGKLTTYTRNFYDLQSTQTYPPNILIAVGATYAGASVSLYANGALANSGTTADSTYNAEVFNVGGTQGHNGDYMFLGAIPLACAWNRVVSDAEMRSLMANPWQLFEAGSGSSAYQAAIASVGAASGSTATTLTPMAAALALTGYAPAVIQPRTLSPSSAVLALTGGAPSIVQPQTIAPTAAALALTGYAPTVTQVMPQTLAPASALLALSTSAPTVMQGAQAPALVSDGGGAGPVREVRAYGELLTRASKPTRSQKKARRRALEVEALELLPDLPQAEALAPIAARIVYEQEARALAPLYANRPIQAMAPVVMPFDAHAALRDLVARLLAEAQAHHERNAEDESDTELLLLGG